VSLSIFYNLLIEVYVNWSSISSFKVIENVDSNSLEGGPKLIMSTMIYLYSEVGNTLSRALLFSVSSFQNVIVLQGKFSVLLISFCLGYLATLCAEMGDLLLVTYSMLDKLGFTCTLLWANANHYIIHKAPC
jgi:hypothetical protein